MRPVPARVGLEREGQCKTADQKQAPADEQATAAPCDGKSACFWDVSH